MRPQATCVRDLQLLESIFRGVNPTLVRYYEILIIREKEKDLKQRYSSFSRVSKQRLSSFRPHTLVANITRKEKEKDLKPRQRQVKHNKDIDALHTKKNGLWCRVYGEAGVAIFSIA